MLPNDVIPRGNVSVSLQDGCSKRCTVLPGQCRIRMIRARWVTQPLNAYLQDTVVKCQILPHRIVGPHRTHDLQSALGSQCRSSRLPCLARLRALPLLHFALGDSDRGLSPCFHPELPLLDLLLFLSDQHLRPFVPSVRPVAEIAENSHG
jgi:hypothetical protein